MATMYAQTFGPRRAPANWARVTILVSWILQKVFDVWIAIYVDDCSAVEPAVTASSALGALKHVAPSWVTTRTT